MLISKAELQNLMFFVDNDTRAVYSRPLTSPIEQLGEPVFGEFIPTNMRFCHLLAASPLMYQTLALQSEQLHGLIMLFDDIPSNPHTIALEKQLTGLKKACDMALTVAALGIDETSKIIQRFPHKD